MDDDAVGAVAAPLARYAPYRRAGDLLLMSGIIAVDPAANRIVNGYADISEEARRWLGATGGMSVDSIEGPVVAQSWYVLEKIRTTMESAGGGLGDVVRLVQYFTDLRDFPLYSRVRDKFFGETVPASTVVEVAGMLPSPLIRIEVEATAYLPMGPQ